MLDLLVQYLDIIVAGLFGLAFLARFVAAKRVALKLTALLQVFYKAQKDGKWTKTEYENFGRKAVPVIEEVGKVLKGLLPTKTNI